MIHKEVAVKSSVKSGELWSKLLLQAVLVANAIWDFGIEIDDTTALQIVGGIEALFQGGRPYVKRAAANNGVSVQ